MSGTNHYVVTVHAENANAGNQDCDNVFVYEQGGGTGGASELMLEFMANQQASIATIVAGSYLFRDCQVICLEDPTDFDQTFVGADGTRTGQGMPSFVAAGFTYARTSRAFNNGSKRFSPLSESDMDSGTPTPDYLTALIACAAVLAAPIIDGATTSTWTPVIWRRPGTYVSGVVSAPGLFNPVDEVRFSAITSQNTRKVGRGS